MGKPFTKRERTGAVALVVVTVLIICIPFIAGFLKHKTAAENRIEVVYVEDGTATKSHGDSTTVKGSTSHRKGSTKKSSKAGAKNNKRATKKTKKGRRDKATRDPLNEPIPIKESLEGNK